jgi:hypothetical protein
MQRDLRIDKHFKNVMESSVMLAENKKLKSLNNVILKNNNAPKKSI